MDFRYLVRTAVFLSCLPLLAQLGTTRTKIDPALLTEIVLPCSPHGGGTMRSHVTTCYGGLEVRGTVVLSRAASAPGLGVTLTSSHPSVAPVTAVFVPGGQSQSQFMIRTNPVGQATTVTITGFTSDSDRKTRDFVLLPPRLLKIALTPASTIGGVDVQGKATFNAPPAGANSVRVTLASTAADAWASPSSVALPVGAVEVPFVIKTRPVAKDSDLIIRGTFADITVEAPLKIQPPVLTSFSANNRCYVPCEVGVSAGLTGNAASPGVSVTLASSHPAVLQVPAQLNIPAGSQAGQVKASVTETGSIDVTLTAKYDDVTKTSKVEVRPAKKGDLIIEQAEFKNRFGQVITQLSDSYPFSVCMTIGACTSRSGSTTNCPTNEPIGATLTISYSDSRGVGRSFDTPVDFPGYGTPGVYGSGGFQYITSLCKEIPGLANTDDWYDVTLVVDSKDVIDEAHEGNNQKKLHIER